jgi:predicted DNA binding CopG/RHH family protein
MKKIKPIFNLTKEEQAEHDALVRGGYKSTKPTAKKKQEFVEVAKNTIAKNKMITIRLSERNLVKIKAAAAREGLPYQTFISALIHKHVS